MVFYLMSCIKVESVFINDLNVKVNFFKLIEDIVRELFLAEEDL